MAKQPCRRPGCGNLAARGYCDGCRERGAGKDARPTASQRLYGSAWQRARAGYLALHPLCMGFHGAGCDEHLVAATVVDHVVPHGGDRALFWDAANWQPLCKQCHDRKTASQDGGFGRPKRLSEP